MRHVMWMDATCDVLHVTCDVDGCVVCGRFRRVLGGKKEGIMHVTSFPPSPLLSQYFHISPQHGDVWYPP